MKNGSVSKTKNNALLGFATLDVDFVDEVGYYSTALYFQHSRDVA